ncbi:hypothetical protein DFH09DRAFT_1220044 [Mycena vulgaris]|nr:hypothetical protein DFH09DRAFT_1220044 [Mycena vulgaris]
MSGNTLPRYVSTPPTPVVADPNVGFVRGGGLAAPAAVGNEAEGRRRRHPSFRVMPPEEDMRQGIATPIVCPSEHGDGEAMPGALEFPQAPMENPYDREPPTHHAAAPPAASPHPSRADDHLGAPGDGDGGEPVSIHTRPLPTEDYRRMSAHDVSRPHSRTTSNSGSFSADSPLFLLRAEWLPPLLQCALSPPLGCDGPHHRRLPTLRPSRRISSRGITPRVPPPSPPTRAPPRSALHPPHVCVGSPRSPPHDTGAIAALQRPETRRRLPRRTASPSRTTPAFSPPSPPTPRSRRPHARAVAQCALAGAPPPPPLRDVPRPRAVDPAAYAPRAPDASVFHPGLARTVTHDHATPGRQPRRGDSPAQKHVAQMLAPVYMQMQGGGQLAVMQGGSGYAYAYSSPTTMPAPAQTVQ